MHLYVENLELKVKKFQEKYKKNISSNSGSLSKEQLSVSSSLQNNEESKSHSLVISRPLAIFSC